VENEKDKKCNCEKEEKKKPPPPKPPKPTKPKPPNTQQDNCCSDIEIICTSICGNVLLDQDVPEIVIWKKELNEKALVTISVFNSVWSTTSLRVLVIRWMENPVILNVPKGNTLSATVEDVISIWVIREGEGIAEGTFCLEICVPLCDKKSFFK